MMKQPQTLDELLAWLEAPREEKADTSPGARRGWLDATLGADQWASDPCIDGEDAACLLAGFHPTKAPDDWDTHTSEFAGPTEFDALRKWCRQCEPMSLAHWHAAALKAGKFVDPWVGECLSDTPAPETPKSAGNIGGQQDAAIHAAIKDLGLNPMQLVKGKPRNPGSKSAVRERTNGRLFFTAKAFDHAWTRLFDRGELAYQALP